MKKRVITWGRENVMQFRSHDLFPEMPGHDLFPEMLGHALLQTHHFQ